VAKGATTHLGGDKNVLDFPVFSGNVAAFFLSERPVV
jgi:hypothetical protein